MQIHRFVIVLLTVISSFTIVMSAPIEKNGVFYEVSNDVNHTMKVVAPPDGSYEGEIELAASLLNDGILYSIDEISSQAFKNSNITSISFANRIEVIGDEAFSGCQKLQCVKNAKFLRDIGKMAFYACPVLSSIECENTTLIGIGKGAFYRCNLLSDINLNLKNLQILGDEAFYGCSSLKGIVTLNINVPDFCFFGCESIDGCVLGKGVLKVGDYAFSGCKQLSDVDLSDSVISLGNSSFAGCGNLDNIVLNNNINSIDKFAFRDCVNLANITFPQGISFLGEGVCLNCRGLKSANIDTYYSAIPNNAFKFCSSLHTVEIGDGIKEIGEEAFYYCESLQEIYTGLNVAIIGDSAFESCTNLNDVMFSALLSDINSRAFADCKNIKSVCVMNTLPPALTTTSFDKSAQQKATLYVPVGTKELYSQTPHWQEFENIEASSNFPQKINTPLDCVFYIDFTSSGNLYILNGDGEYVSILKENGVIIWEGVWNNGNDIKIPEGIIIINIGGSVKKLINRF